MEGVLTFCKVVSSLQKAMIPPVLGTDRIDRSTENAWTALASASPRIFSLLDRARKCGRVVEVKCGVGEESEGYEEEEG